MGDVEAITRPLLQALHELTGLDSTYLTSIDWDDDVQRILYSRNESDAFEIPEGLEVTWSDTLCRRALESGIPCTSAVSELWGDSDAAQALGIRTYASQPVRLPDGSIFGTLCGASDRDLDLDDRAVHLLRVFSQIIADAVARERQLVEARSRAEWASERLQSRVRFLAAAEHKLKTPLAVIVAWVRMLEELDLSIDDRGKALVAISRSATNLQVHVEEMLEEAQAELLGTDLELGPIDASDVVRRAAQDLEALFVDHELVLEIEDGVRVRTDARGLGVVVEHLLENAVKYTPEGTTVTCCVARAEGGGARVVIRDDGPGLPAGVDVFEPFSRGKSDKPGSGLGLYIVASLVTAMGGTIATLDADPGAAFEVTLPPV